MQKKPTTTQSRRTKSIILISCFALLSGCGGRKVRNSEEDLTPPSDSQKIENLSAALSRAQSRIEELDAKVSSLTDKLDSTKVQLDNVTGNKPLKTQPVGAVVETKVEKPEPKKAAAVVAAHHEEKASNDEGIESFRQAMNVFKAAKYTDAVLAFNRFTENHPESILAGSAQFYAGESYFKLGEYKLAQAEFEKVITTFGSSPRVASSMVRISQCQAALGQNQESLKTASIAKELFKGNPALELSAAAAPAASTSRPAAHAVAAPATSDLETKEIKKDSAELEPMGAEDHAD